MTSDLNPKSWGESLEFAVQPPKPALIWITFFCSSIVVSIIHRFLSEWILVKKMQKVYSIVV